MKYIIEDNINIVEEVKNTLYFIVNEEKLVKSLRDGLKENGVDVDKYINKNFKNYFKFIDRFKSKNKIPMDRLKVFFKDITSENEESPCIAAMFINNMPISDLIEGRKRILSLEEHYLIELTKKDILSEANYAEDCELEEMDADKEFMPYLINKCALTDEDKWWITVIAQDPKKYLIELIDMILESIDIFKDAFKVMEKDLLKSIEELKALINDNENFISEITGIKDLESWERNIHVYISIVRYNSISIMSNRKFIFNKDKVEYMYFGWKFYELLKLSRGNDIEIELLNNRLKCLSDKSKFNIIKMLKEKPMFGQEIANRLSLTTATVSYHMNALILAKLVYMEKIDNKVFYSADRAKIDEFLNILKRELN